MPGIGCMVLMADLASGVTSANLMQYMPVVSSIDGSDSNGMAGCLDNGKVTAVNAP